MKFYISLANEMNHQLDNLEPIEQVEVLRKLLLHTEEDVLQDVVCYSLLEDKIKRVMGGCE